MRPTLYACILLTFFASACKKSNDPGNASLFNKWKMISYTQGFTGQTFTVPADSSCYLAFNKDNSYQRQVKETVQSGTYLIVTINSIFNKQSPAIEFDQSSTSYSVPFLFEIHQDTLDLYMNAYDGNGYRYIRTDNGDHPTNGGR